MNARREDRGGWLRVAVIVALPLMMGGCPELRDDAVGAFETAVRTVVNAALDEYFNDFRSNNL